MEEEEKKHAQVNVFELVEAFRKIHAGLDEKYLVPVEEQMSMVMPLPDSEVVTMPGYGEPENQMSVVFFVSKPKGVAVSKEHKFMDTITALLMKSDTDKLLRVKSCLTHLEKKGERYKINGTITDYSEKLGDYTFYLFISKV